VSTERLSPLVRRVLAPNPSPWTLEGTNTYLVGRARPVVIDPGPDDPAHLDAVLEEAGGASGILLTHRHPDHAEGAAAFAARADAPILDEDETAVDGGRLRRIPTPGHSSDHVAFLLAEEHALFSGDHVLGRGTTVVAHPDGDMRAYLESLERVQELAPSRIYPGHGPVIEDPEPVLAFYRRHRGEREAKVIAALGVQARSLDEILARAYDDVAPEVEPAARLSLQAHLAKLVDDGLAHAEGDAWRLR